MRGLETVSLLKQLQVRCFKEKVCVCVRERKLRHQHRGACVICEPVFGIASNSWQPICPVIVPWEKKSHMTSRRKNSSLHPSKSLLGLLEILQSLRITIGMTRSRRRQGWIEVVKNGKTTKLNRLVQFRTVKGNAVQSLWRFKWGSNGYSGVCRSKQCHC